MRPPGPLKGEVMAVQPANAGSGSIQPVGTGEYVVEQGECVISIADAAGHFWKTIWDHPDNAEVKRARGSPHVLMAGDCLHVPDKRLKEETCATEKTHRFKRKGIPIHFEIRVEENGRPLSGNRYVLEIEGRLSDGTIPSDGVIKANMMPRDQQGELRVHVNGKVRVYPLAFGHLDPAHTQAGAEGRLRNLGYVGIGANDEAFAAALKRFKKDNGLEESDTLDDATAAKLSEIHGS